MEECSICLEPINIADLQTAITKCNHYFHIKCISNWIYENNNCPVCRNNEPFDYFLNLNIYNDTLSYQKQVDIPVINGKSIKKIIEIEFPHLLELGYRVICGSIQVNLNMDTLKCYYRPMNRVYSCDLSIIDTHLQNKIMYRQNIIRLNFTDFDKLRKRRFPHSYNIIELEHIKVDFCNKEYSGRIIKRYEKGVLIYFEKLVPITYIGTRYLYISYDGTICKLPVYYNSLEISIPSDYNIDEICYKLNDVQVNLCKVIDLESSDSNQIDLYCQERTNLEQVYDTELILLYRASFSQNQLIKIK